MSIEKIRVETFREILYCDKCRTEMVYTGVSLPVHPMLYLHKCNRCKHEERTTSRFPRIIHKEIVEEK